ncbi:uncharacterized protein ASPGLDRAFT_35822 [Aspergillus glaucus CBS 516.65]|uniref:Uncharacterized protein n=1 Tax=Aspergillus glaucus CBS 516.65 TaxID=1160497 RepID=A0A1L9VIQ3_ASPGL|nr:hypothetical protein ASPGLDRAFT_35822 [Aspergillus glaucus CBS 516.65]OJJ83811.1 hypothetical protein ASPGLDRAFT_35822 [Aspergillus glaucus CBS 516.65]
MSGSRKSSHVAGQLENAPQAILASEIPKVNHLSERPVLSLAKKIPNVKPHDERPVLSLAKKIPSIKPHNKGPVPSPASKIPEDTERDVETHDWEDKPLFEDESDASSEDGHNELTGNGMESHPNCHMQGVILGEDEEFPSRRRAGH